MPREQERFFKNAKTWKQISTNVPPEMLRALKKQLKDEYTMSHLLRDIIAESDVMQNHLPQPIWSKELARNIASLQEEVASLREELSTIKDGAIPSTKDPAVHNDLQFAPDFDPSDDVEFEEEPQTSVDLAKANTSTTLFGRITEMLGVARRTA